MNLDYLQTLRCASTWTIDATQCRAFLVFGIGDVTMLLKFSLPMFFLALAHEKSTIPLILDQQVSASSAKFSFLLWRIKKKIKKNLFKRGEGFSKRASFKKSVPGDAHEHLPCD